MSCISEKIVGCHGFGLVVFFYVKHGRRRKINVSKHNTSL
jgi:hypothetical protein